MTMYVVNSVDGLSGELGINGVPALRASSTNNIVTGVAPYTLVGNGPVVIATGNSQSIPTGTPTDLLLANESIDTGGYFTGGVFTPLVAGYYQVSASVEWGSTAAALSTLGIFKNATAMIIAKGLISSTTASTLNVSYLVYMNGSTDYITARVTQSTAGALNAIGSNFSAVLVRSA